MYLTLIPRIRHEHEPTNGVDTGLMLMTDLPLLERLDVKAGKCAYAWFTIQIEKRSRRMSINLL